MKVRPADSMAGPGSSSGGVFGRGKAPHDHFGDTVTSVVGRPEAPTALWLRPSTGGTPAHAAASLSWLGAAPSGPAMPPGLEGPMLPARVALRARGSAVLANMGLGEGLGLGPGGGTATLQPNDAFSVDPSVGFSSTGGAWPPQDLGPYSSEGSAGPAPWEDLDAAAATAIAVGMRAIC